MMHRNRRPRIRGRGLGIEDRQHVCLWGAQGLSLVQAVGMGDAESFFSSLSRAEELVVCFHSAVKTTRVGNSPNSPLPV